MVLFGTLMNGLAIIVGSLLGFMWIRIKEESKDTILQSLSLAMIILGIGMGLQSDQFLLMFACVALGGMIGEASNLEGKLEQLGKWFEKKLKANENSGIAFAFVSATLFYAVGAMAIMGAMESGMKNDHTLLLTKALVDGISAIFFTSTLGIGVILSAIPVVIYQGSIALLSAQITQWIPAELMSTVIVEMTGVGGILIVAIGLNLLGVTKIRSANLLPSLVLVVLWVLVAPYLSMYLPFIG